jgi:CheY-like chemotaxis protein
MDNDSAPGGKKPQQALRVLVVDDSPDITEGWKLLLSMAGYQVATAADGIEALRMVDEHKPHAVLCDLKMPRLDGYGVARKLLERGKEKPVLFALTAHGSDDDRRRCFEAGFDGHFMKPVDAAMMIKLLKDVSAQWGAVASGDTTDETA